MWAYNLAALAMVLSSCQHGTGASNAIVPSMGLRLYTMIQQMSTLHLPPKTTNPNPNTLTLMTQDTPYQDEAPLRKSVIM